MNFKPKPQTTIFPLQSNPSGVYNCAPNPLQSLIFFLRAFKIMSSVAGRLTMSAEQRTNLKFLVQLGKTPSEALGMLQKVYGDETMSRSRVFEWCKRFKEGREDVEDDPRSGRPSTSRNEANVERVKQMVRDDRRLTVRKIADELGMNHNSVWKIITEDLGMRKVCAKMVPRLLNDDQKGRRMQVCQDILERLETEPDLLRRVITGDESWVFEYDPRPNARAFNGRVRRRHGRRKQGSPGPASRSC
ncbi:hypothetical protein O3P69_011329 [Scylla paramamosain]|uniref:Mos1 transposase HTH domain-containing protein n=1 Tax=Scylla paramamosain TaxID=85552 RepID=A0AAW0SIZ6_SCYPA